MRSDLHATFGGKPLPVPLTGACPQKHSTLLSAPLLTDIMKFYFQIIPFSAGLSSDIVTEKTIIFLCDTNKFQPEIWYFSRKETGGEAGLQKRGKGRVFAPEPPFWDRKGGRRRRRPPQAVEKADGFSRQPVIMPLFLCREAARKYSLRSTHALQSKACAAFDPIRGGLCPLELPL